MAKTVNEIQTSRWQQELGVSKQGDGTTPARRRDSSILAPPHPRRPVSRVLYLCKRQRDPSRHQIHDDIMEIDATEKTKGLEGPQGTAQTIMLRKQRAKASSPQEMAKAR